MLPVGEELLFLLLQHGRVGADKLHVAAGGDVVAALELLPESVCGLADGCVHIHTHLPHLQLQALSHNNHHTHTCMKKIILPIT